MKYTEALEAVNKSYVPGVVAFYDRMDPNPWQQAHDTLERALNGGLDEYGRTQAAKNFHDRLIQLIQAYKTANLPTPRGLTVADALSIGDPTVVKELQSVKYRVCFECGETNGISIEPVTKGSARVRLVCTEHKARP